MRIGLEIRRLRKLNNLTLKELSDKAGISISYLSDIENERKNGSIKTLDAIAKALNIETSKLLDNNKNSSTSQDNPENTNQKIIDEIIEVLIEQKIIESRNEKLSDEKRAWLLDMLKKSIEVTKIFNNNSNNKKED